MNGTFQIRNFLICDEVRQEVGGKQIIIGAYAGVILAPSVPYTANMLTIRFEVVAHKYQFDHVGCTVFRPNNEILYTHDMPFTVNYPQFPIPILFVIPYPIFEQSGDYNVFLAMDSTPNLVGTFKIITREFLIPSS